MREPAFTTNPYGLLAEFNDGDKLLAAVRQAREVGYRRIDAVSPFPVEGLAEAIGFRENRVPLLALVGGVLGAGLGVALQVYTNVAFPLNVGGRPLIAWPAFMLITFELMVLVAVSSAIFGMIFLNRLPRLHHPLFNVPSFHLASADKFFLVILGDDPQFGLQSTHDFLKEMQPVRIDEVRCAEAPE
jgi:hypothetical protein